MSPGDLELAAATRLDVQALATAMLDNNRLAFEVALNGHAPLPALAEQAGKLLRDAASAALRHLWDLPGDQTDLAHCWQSSRFDFRTALAIQHSVFLDAQTWRWLDSLMTLGGDWVPASDQALALATALYCIELCWQAMPRDAWPLFLAGRG